MEGPLSARDPIVHFISVRCSESMRGEENGWEHVHYWPGFLHRAELVDWKLLATVFVSIFIAEMADKTQLVTMLFATDKAVSKWVVFLGSASALVLASAIGVAAGALLSQFINMKILSIIAGSGFILIGAWTLYHGLQAA